MHEIQYKLNFTFNKLWIRYIFFIYNDYFSYHCFLPSHISLFIQNDLLSCGKTMCTQQGFTVRPSLILKRQRCCMMGQALLRGRNLPRSVAHCWRPNTRRSKRLVTRVRQENLRISRQLRYMAWYNGESLATSFSKVTTRTNSACDAPPPSPQTGNVCIIIDYEG